MRFFIHSIPGPHWLKGETVIKQPFAREHGYYIQKLFNKGKIIFAGPFRGYDVGGAVIFEAEDYEEAKAIVENDPFVVNQTVTPVWHQWETIFDGIAGKSPNFGAEQSV